MQTGFRQKSLIGKEGGEGSIVWAAIGKWLPTNT